MITTLQFSYKTIFVEALQNDILWDFMPLNYETEKSRNLSKSSKKLKFYHPSKREENSSFYSGCAAWWAWSPIIIITMCFFLDWRLDGTINVLNTIHHHSIHWGGLLSIVWYSTWYLMKSTHYFEIRKMNEDSSVAARCDLFSFFFLSVSKVKPGPLKIALWEKRKGWVEYFHLHW